MNNPYNSIIQYQEVGGDMVERLRSLGMFDVFEPLITNMSGNPENFNKALFYLAHCYSRNSEFHVQYTDWEIVKKEVGKHLSIDVNSDFFQDMFYLRNKAFAQAVRRYLDYQGSKAFKHLVMLKDLYEQMVNAAVEYITDGDDKVNYDQKFKNAEMSEKLYHKINEWEQRIEQDNAKLIKPIEQLKAVEKKDSHTLRLEDNLLPT